MGKILNYFGYIKISPTNQLERTLKIIFCNHPSGIKTISDLGTYVVNAE